MLDPHDKSRCKGRSLTLQFSLSLGDKTQIDEHLPYNASNINVITRADSNYNVHL